MLGNLCTFFGQLCNDNSAAAMIHFSGKNSLLFKITGMDYGLYLSFCEICEKFRYKRKLIFSILSVCISLSFSDSLCKLCYDYERNYLFIKR